MDDLSDRTDLPDGRFEDEEGHVFWSLNGALHRVDGPAIEWYSSDRWWWFLNGVNYSFANWLSVNTEISAEHKVMLKLKYG